MAARTLLAGGNSPVMRTLVVALAAAILCFAALSPLIPLTFDEAYNFQHFASKGVFYSATHYDAPNNHVLYSLLQGLTIPDTLFELLPKAVRIPNLVIFGAAFWLFLRFSRSSLPRSTFAFSAILFAAPTVTIYFFVARGYFLGSLLLLGTAVFCRLRIPLIAAIFGALAIYCCPTYTFAVVGITASYLLITGFKDLQTPRMLALGCSVITGALYAPIVTDVLANSAAHNPYPADAVFWVALGSTLTSFGNVLPPALTLSILAAPLIPGALLARNRESVSCELQLSAMLGLAAWCSIVLILLLVWTNVMPFPFMRSIHFVPFLIAASMVLVVIAPASDTVERTARLVVVSYLTLNTTVGIHLFVTSFGARDPEAFPFYEELSPTPLEWALFDGLDVKDKLVAHTPWMQPVVTAYAPSKGYKTKYMRPLTGEVVCAWGNRLPRNRKRDVMVAGSGGVVCY